MVDNNQEPWYDSKPSTDDKKSARLSICELNDSIFKYLVIYFVGSRIKILRISWYKRMTPFRENLQLVIKRYFCQCHNSFPGIYYNSKK